MGELMTVKERDITPLTMWFILFAGIILLGTLRHDRTLGTGNGSPIHLDDFMVALYLFWMVIELRITRRDLDTKGKRTRDLMTCQLYGVGQALTILTALWFPSRWYAVHTGQFIGIGVFVLGVCYRLWAIRTLGDFYSHRVRIKEHHLIVATGPYRMTRHPAYAGMIIANAGISTYFLNWFTVSVFLLILLPAIVLRIKIEERMLFQIDGYPEFAVNRKRLLPGIW